MIISPSNYHGNKDKWDISRGCCLVFRITLYRDYTVFISGVTTCRQMRLLPQWKFGWWGRGSTSAIAPLMTR